MIVYERLDREILVNTYWHSATMLYIKRARRWFSVMEPILKKNGIPDDFKYLAVTESGLDNVVSPAGATGFWQFLKSTGERYGLEINSEVDERYNVIKSTEAACKYLLEAYEKFGTWTAAAASYNKGMNGIERQIERQMTRSYYNMVLNDETSRYIFRIVALKEIMNNPRNYGFYINDEDIYPVIETDELLLSGGVENFAEFAAAKGINYMTLKLFNPWLRDNYLTNKSKKPINYYYRKKEL